MALQVVPRAINVQAVFSDVVPVAVWPQNLSDQRYAPRCHVSSLRFRLVGSPSSQLSAAGRDTSAGRESHHVGEGMHEDRGLQHQRQEAGACYTGNQWNIFICTDGDTCARNCAFEGLTANAQQYQNTYGIPGGVRLGFVTGANLGSRLFLQ